MTTFWWFVLVFVVVVLNQKAQGDLRRQRRKTLRFQVSEQDIREGKRGLACVCPVALSMRRSLDKIVFVSSASIGIYISGGSMQFVTPERVSRRIKYYDHTGKMKPFDFELKP